MAVNDAVTTCSRLLISSPGFYRHFVAGDYLLRVYDRSSLPLLIEEFIAHAAVEIAVPAHSLAASHLANLHPVLKAHVRLVDEDSKIKRSMHAALASIFEEFGLEVHNDGSLVVRENVNGSNYTPEAASAVAVLEEELYDFLLGAQLQLQVGLRFDQLQKAVAYLRKQAKTPDARATLAALTGALATYRRISVPAIAVVPAATEEQAYRFRTFLEDESYRQLSRAAGSLGIAGKVQRGKQLMGRHIRDLAMKPILKSLFNVGTKSISAATNIAGPEVDFLEALVPRGYFPPITGFDGIYTRAYSAWRSAIPGRSIIEALTDLERLTERDKDFFLYGEVHFGEPWREVPMLP